MKPTFNISPGRKNLNFITRKSDRSSKPIPYAASWSFCFITTASEKSGALRKALGGAGNGVRTRDPKLGKLVLYQLSYARPLAHTANKQLYLFC